MADGDASMEPYISAPVYFAADLNAYRASAPNGQLLTNRRFPDLVRRIFYCLALLLASWCVMTLTHEMGHIVGGWCSGGTLKNADLWPWHLPYSIFDPDPMPLVTLWCGPLLGVFVPLLTALVVRRDSMWFIANFCVIANGAYLATAWLSGERHLDTPKLLEHGAHPISIAVYCVLTIGFGYVGFRRSCIRVFAQPASGA